MPSRQLKSRILPGLVVITAAGALVGAAILTRAPHRASLATPATSASPQAAVQSATPVASSTPTDSASPSAPSAPAVAGAATATPKPATAATSRPSTPAPVSAAATPATQTVTLGLIYPGVNTTFSLPFQPGTDACGILTQAKAAGKIASLSIDYSTLNTSLKSAYVREINSFAEGWTFKLNGVSPLGCSLVQIKPNDNVTWRYQ